MIHRRTLLAGTVGLTLSGLLTSCGANAADTLKIMLLEGSVPSEVLTKFGRQVSTGAVTFDLVAQLATVFQRLQVWQQMPQTEGSSGRRLFPWSRPDEVPKPDNLVSLGDYWLTSAIAQDLLEPLEMPSASWAKLPVAWQQFVSRNNAGESVLDAESNSVDTGSVNPASGAIASLWAAPYRVQSLVILYRRSKFPTATVDHPPFKAWRDLLQPQLNQKLALPDHPRLVLGLLQKIQSGSFNPNFEVNVASESSQFAQQLAKQVEEPFTQLNQQVKTYDSQNAFKALINGDVDAAVGWSGAAITTLNRYRDLRMVVPTEGSLLSADMWVRPKGVTMSLAAQAWIDFCWKSEPATQISTGSNGLSPIFLTEESRIPTVLNNNLLPMTAMRNSEPLFPMSAAQQLAYFALWQQLRAS